MASMKSTDLEVAETAVMGHSVAAVDVEVTDTGAEDVADSAAMVVAIVDEDEEVLVEELLGDAAPMNPRMPR